MKYRCRRPPIDKSKAATRHQRQPRSLGQPSFSRREAAKRCIYQKNSVCLVRQLEFAEIGRGVLLEPDNSPFDVKAWFDRLDTYLDDPFMAGGREQPAMPPPRKVFDE